MPRRSRAARAQARMSRQFPYSRYGRRYVERGTESNLQRYGKSAWSARMLANDSDLSKAAIGRQQLANRQADGYIGRGGYIGRTLGRFAGDKIGLGSAGAIVGDKAGDWLWGKTKGLLGMGLYEGRGAYGRTVRNQLMAGSHEGPPRVSSVGDETGALIVTHREYVSDLFGNSSDKLDFQNRVYELNPGLERTFPWLSQIAQNYEEYEFGQLVFEYKATINPTISSTNGQSGTTVMATNYNAEAIPFDDKTVMMQYDASASGRMTESQVHGVECDPAKISGSAGHYIRVAPKSGQDLKTYDHGLFQIATVGCPSAFSDQVIGELWVYYTVKLRKPRLFSARGLNVSRDLFVANNCNPAVPATTNIAKASTNNIGCKLLNTGEIVGSAVPSLNGWSKWTLTFPASFSGSVEVKLHCAGAFVDTWSDAAMQTGVYQIFGYKENAADVDSDLIPYIDQGSIEAIKDIHGSFPRRGGFDSDGVGATGNAQTQRTQSLTPFKPQFCSQAVQRLAGTGSATASADGSAAQDRLVATAHYRVRQSIGEDNVIRFYLPGMQDVSTNPASSGVHGNQMSLEVTEYNTFSLPVDTPVPRFVEQDNEMQIVDITV